MIKTCAICGEKFSAGRNSERSGRAITCSQVCGKENFKRLNAGFREKNREEIRENYRKTHLPKNKKCLVCGKLFYCGLGTKIKANQKLCSADCREKRHRKISRESMRRERGFGPRKKKCIICGRIFWCGIGTDRGGMAKTCSAKCSTMNLRNHQYDRKSIKKTCPYCGKVFLAGPNEQRTRKAKYCSPDCAYLQVLCLSKERTRIAGKKERKRRRRWPS